MVFVLNFRYGNFFSLFTFFFSPRKSFHPCVHTRDGLGQILHFLFARGKHACTLFVFRCPGTKLIALLSGIVCPCFRVCLLFALCQGRRLNLLFTLFSHCAGQGALRCKVRCFDWHIVVWDCIK